MRKEFMDINMKKLIKFILFGLSLMMPYTAVSANNGYSVDFTGQEAVANWENIENVSFGTDKTVGNYMIADGAAAASAPKTETFSTGDYVCVEFDMMIPSKKSDGETENTIGGGNTGGIAFMQGDTVAGIIGFRGNSKGQPDHILSSGGTSGDYLNMQTGTSATAYRDTWLHYKVVLDMSEKTGDIYVTDQKTGAEYVHENRFSSYISNISELTNIGIVSNSGYSIGIANLNVYDSMPVTFKISSPSERQIIQRNSKNRAEVPVCGTYDWENPPEQIEIRAEVYDNARNGKSTDWNNADFADGEFKGSLELMAGGWYKIHIRLKYGDEYMTEEVSRVGVGDIFLTAGQSNSASFGQDKTTPVNDTVSTWDPNTGQWVFSSDPQVSWSGSFVGSGGSPWPTLGDYLTEKYGVPIGFISSGWGSSVVADFLPENNKHYKRLSIPLKEFGINGIKAVLWHQGESDAIAKTTAEEYTSRLLSVINASREDAGYCVPWVIARAAFHPDSEKSDEDIIVSAQIASCNSINIFEGPTTEDLGSEFRSSSDHVHFNRAGLIEHGTRWGKSLDNVIYHGTSEVYIGNVDAALDEDMLNVSFILNNTDDIEKSYSIYTALYEDGKLIDIDAANAENIKPDEYYEANSSLLIPDGNSEYEAKIFIWSYDMQQPVILPIKLM